MLNEAHSSDKLLTPQTQASGDDFSVVLQEQHTPHSEKPYVEQDFSESFLTGREERAYTADDLLRFARINGLSMTELTNVFSPGGMGASAFIKRIGSGDTILQPSLQILFRLYLRYPETIPRPERLTVSEFFVEELGGEANIATRFRGVLFGVDKNSSYNWEKNSNPISHVMSAMHAAKRLKKINNLTPQELLAALLDITNATTQALKVNPMKPGSWAKTCHADDVLKLDPNLISERSVKMRGRRVSLSDKNTKKGVDQSLLHKLTALIDEHHYFGCAA